MSKKAYQIPFIKHNRETRMMEYVGHFHQPTEWRDNYTFSANLEIVGHYRGRSAARIKVKNQKNGEIYSFGFGSFYDAVTKFPVVSGMIVGGTYTFKKQGSNYGLVVTEHCPDGPNCGCDQHAPEL